MLTKLTELLPPGGTSKDCYAKVNSRRNSDLRGIITPGQSRFSPDTRVWIEGRVVKENATSVSIEFRNEADETAFIDIMKHNIHKTFTANEDVKEGSSVVVQGTVSTRFDDGDIEVQFMYTPHREDLYDTAEAVGGYAVVGREYIIKNALD